MLIGLGFIALTFAFSYIVPATDISNYEFSELVSDIPEEQILEYNSPLYKIDVKNNRAILHTEDYDLENETFVNYRILLKTKDVFSVGNPIEYKILAKVIGKPLVEEIVFFIETRGVDYSVVDKDNIEDLILRLKGESVIELFEVEPGKIKKEDIISFERDTITLPFGLTYFEHESFFTLPITMDVSFFPFIIGNDGTVYHVDKADKLVAINPAHIKSQAETNRIIVKDAQIQERNNDLTLGLSLIVVGGIPFTIAAQILTMNKQNDFKKKQT